jgi:hypothetical protein
MAQANSQTNGVLRFLSEVLLAGTLASAFLTRLIFSGEIYWSGQFFGWYAGFNNTFRRPYGDYLGVNLAFCSWVVALTVVAVVLLRALSRISLAKRIIRNASGAIATAAPTVCLWPVAQYRLQGWPPSALLLGLEASGAVTFALLCAWSRRTIPLPVTAVVLALHCAFWLSLFCDALEVFPFCWKTLPIIAYFSAVTSAYYVRRCRCPLPAVQPSPFPPLVK